MDFTFYENNFKIIIWQYMSTFESIPEDLTSNDLLRYKYVPTTSVNAHFPAAKIWTLDVQCCSKTYRSH